MNQYLETTANIDGDYRYSLTRTWRDTPQAHGTLIWIMLNPSTADAYQDDPTIRRCVSFSKRWGHNKVVILNLFALRSTDPKALLTHHSPVGPFNDDYLMAHCRNCGVVLAWGAHKAARDRGKEVIELIKPTAHLFCLGRTKSGAPKHPLYVAGNTQLQEWPE